MHFARIALLLLGILTRLSLGAASYTSLALPNNFIVSGLFGLVEPNDASGNPTLVTFKSLKFKGTSSITIQVSGD